MALIQRLSDNISGRCRRHSGTRIQIRARLLNRLGSKAFFLMGKTASPLLKTIKVDRRAIKTKPSRSVSTTPNLSHISLSPPPPRRGQNVNVSTELVRLPHPSIRISYNKRLVVATTETGSVDSDDTPRVRFQTHVNVVEIPSRESYSFHERKTMWRSSREISVLARRNHREYCHDGRDWRTATEEEDMVDVGDGDYLHPYTYRSLRLVGQSNDWRNSCSRKLEKKYEASLT